MLQDLSITARQAVALGEWVEGCEQPAPVELARVGDHLLACQGDDYGAWDQSGADASEEELDRLHAELHAPRPITERADVETVERMRRSMNTLYPGAAPKD